jgi:S1-C subfamily serine protease
MMHYRKFTIFSILGLVLTFSSSTAEARRACVAQPEITKHAALIEKEGKGVGSGVLYENDIVITNHHVVNTIDKIWVHIPEVDKDYSATILYKSKRPDIAILKLNEKVEGIKPLSLTRSVLKKEVLRLVSFPFGRKDLLGSTQARFNSLARLNADSRMLYMNATLADWAYGGDSGGPLFNCRGEIVGIVFGNLVTKGMPEHIYAVNFRALEDALKAAGIEARREY